MKKPNVKITQQITADTVSSETVYLPTILVGAKYDVEDRVEISSYKTGTEQRISYPNKNGLSSVDLNSVQVSLQNPKLEYYDNSSHFWRKLYDYPNRLRTVLSDGVIFKTSAGYPHNSILFKERGVKVGDKVRIETGEDTFESDITGFIFDKSTSSIGDFTPISSNQEAQSHEVSAAVAGVDNSGNTTVTSGGTFVGSLLSDITEEEYTVKVLRGGVEPVFSVVEENTSSDVEAAIAGTFSFSYEEEYTVEILTAGLLGAATYRVISKTGMDNQSVLTTPATGVSRALGTGGATMTLTGTESLAIGDTFVFSCSPSEGQLQFQSLHGTWVKTFPGYTTIDVPDLLGATVTLAKVGDLTQNDSWTFTATKTLVAVTGQVNPDSVFDQEDSVNYFLEVIKGGTFGTALVRITSTDGVSRTVTPESNTYFEIIPDGIEVKFLANSQGGLILGDKFSVSCLAAQNTAYKTIQTKHTIPETGVSFIKSAVTYSGTEVAHNTMAVSGTYVEDSSVFDLIEKETFSVYVTKAGDYATAEFKVVTAYGSGDISDATIISGSGDALDISNSLQVTFTGTELFSLDDAWTFTVTKTSLNVSLLILASEKDITEECTIDENSIVLPAAISVIYDEWSSLEEILVDSGTILVSYRAFNPVGKNVIHYIESEEDALQYFGKNSILNPIGKAIRFVGYNVYAISLPSDSLEGWQEVMDKLEIRGKDEVYRIVPLTTERSYLEAVVSSVNSSNTQNKWREVFLGLSRPTRVDILTSGTATIEGTNKLTTEDSLFTDVTVGDTVEYLGGEYTVTEILTPTQLVISPDFGSTQEVPSPMVIWHIPTKSELVELLKSTWENRKVVQCGIGGFEDSSEETLPDFYMASSIAAWRQTKLPHKPMATYSMTGVAKVPDTLYYFTEAQLDDISDSGVLIMQQDSETQAPYIRNQISTDMTSSGTREISINENLDRISYGILDICEPYVGKYNLHQGIVEVIYNNIYSYLYNLTGVENDDIQSGPSILSFQIVSLEIDANQSDKLNISIRVEIARPLNYIDITITV